MIRWQPLPSLRARLRRADPADLAIAALALTLAVVAGAAVLADACAIASLFHRCS